MGGQHFKWGLALGGGGARGIAHLGVLKVLERADLLPDVITGTSIGALIGGAFACRPDIEELEERFYRVLDPDSHQNKPLKRIARLNWVDSENATIIERLYRSLQKEIFVRIVLHRSGVLSTESLRGSVAAFVPDVDLSETRIPFAPLAVDLISGKPCVLKQGSIIEAVMASCAVPGYMPPVCIGNAMMVDGGLADFVPVAAARSCGVDKVIGVDVGIQLWEEDRIQDGIDIINRAIEVMSHHLGNAGRQACDLLIEPLDRHFEWTNYQSCRELVRRGEDAAEALLGDIKTLLRSSLPAQSPKTP